MDQYVVTVHPGGRITVPAKIRRDHNLQPGDVVIWFEQDGELCFRKARPDEITEGDNQRKTEDVPVSEG